MTTTQYGRRDLPVRVQWSWPRGGDGRTGASLTVRDQASSMILLEINLTGAEATDMLSALNIEVTASVPSRAQMGRIGKEMQVERIPHPADLISGYVTTNPTPEMVEFAEKVTAEQGWDTATWTRHNFGWALTGRRWVDPVADQRKP